MNSHGSCAPAGAININVIRGGSFSSVPAQELPLVQILKHALPRPGLPREVFLWRLRNLPHLFRGLWKIAFARAAKLSHFYGQVSICVLRNGQVIDYGLASLRVVTTAGVNYLVDALQGTVEPELFRFHGIGTGTNAEASANTALQTELTTEYQTNSVRPEGTLAEGASANVFRTVGTITLDSGTPAVTEHGIFSDADVGEGTLLDRSVFSAINLVGANGDGIQVTYDFTINAGG